MTPASDIPTTRVEGPSFKTALLGFLLSNLVMTTAMVLLGSVAG